MGTFTRQQRNPYSNTYNYGWAYNLNFSYKSNNTLQPPQANRPLQGTHYQQPRVSLKEMITQGMKVTQLRVNLNG